MKILIDKNNRIIAYTYIGDLLGSIEIDDFVFEHSHQDYIYENGKIEYFPDLERLKKEYFESIDKYKTEILDYGFDYKVDDSTHRQRCRDKDIIWIAMTALLLFLVKTFLGKEIKKTWYFEDNFGKEMNLMAFVQLMFFGSTFISSVYDTENYFKTQVVPKQLTKEEFESKRKEIHIKLANME